MSKSITEQALNRVNIIGKLLDATFWDGKMKDGRNYIRASITVRVNQTFNGREETSEIPVTLFAGQYTSQGKMNPNYEQIQQLRNLKTAQKNGLSEADIVRISGANIEENNYVSRSGSLVSGWQIRSAFVGTGGQGDAATFTTDIFILDMHPETDREGDSTGRLIIKGGIVGYQSTLNVVEFVVENPDTVDYIERNWNVQDTLNARGRIRVTSVETERATSGWGEDIPQTTTKFVRELIITTGDDQGRDEEFAYDPSDIKKLFNERKARIEQMQIDARNKPAAKKAADAAPTTTKYSWE